MSNARFLIKNTIGSKYILNISIIILIYFFLCDMVASLERINIKKTLFEYFNRI